MHKKFEINLTKIKGGCQSGRKVVLYESKSDLPLGIILLYEIKKSLYYLDSRGQGRSSVD